MKHQNGLLDQGFERIDFRFDHLVDPVISGFEKLLEAHHVFPGLWSFDLRIDESDEMNDGLVCKRHSDGNKTHPKDEKWYFHYNPLLVPLLDERGADLDTHAEFVSACHKLYQAGITEVCERLARLDQVLPGHDFVKRMMVSGHEHRLRIMRYEKPHPGTNIIGKEHTDKSAFTLHLAESYEGLVLDGILRPARLNSAVLFSGDKAKKLAPEYLRALPHHVIKPDHYVDRRWVIVLFVHSDEGKDPVFARRSRELHEIWKPSCE